jgi:cyanophycinase
MANIFAPYCIGSALVATLNAARARIYFRRFLPSHDMARALDSSDMLPTGTLVAWGGGVDEPLLDWLATHLRASVGQRAVIEIVVGATLVRPLVTGRQYVSEFEQRGFAGAQVLHFATRTPPDSAAHLRRLAAADLVFFTGGDQERLTAQLLGTEFLALLRRRYHTTALTVAGTSAGSAALADSMIVAGHGWRSLLGGRVRVEPGLGLRSGVFLDTHFAERNRFARLAHAVLRAPTTLGIGVAEETGVVWAPGATHFTVIGEEVVTVLDGRQSSAPDLAAVPYNEPISGRDVRLHLLRAGDTFGW